MFLLEEVVLGVTVNGAVTVWTLTGAEPLVSNISCFFCYYSLLSVHCQHRASMRAVK